MDILEEIEFFLEDAGFPHLEFRNGTVVLYDSKYQPFEKQEFKKATNTIVGISHIERRLNRLNITKLEVSFS
jgi:hypothetical protein